MAIGTGSSRALALALGNSSSSSPIPGTSLKYLQSILNVFSAGVKARIIAVREGDSTHSSQ
jgi:hypothetical protein